MRQLIKSYLKFLWKSKNEYSIHSPFVFDLMTKCVYDKKPHDEYLILSDFRKSLHENSNVIEVTDFGAGSQVFKSNRRMVSDIAKNAGISRRRAELLLRLTKCFKPEHVLEIGTSLGLATSALSAGNPLSQIITLEGCPKTAFVARQQFEKFGLTNISLVITEFDEYLRLGNHPATIDLIYFDGNHKKEATLHYFEALLHTAHNGSLWIFDDIHWSQDMEEAWEIIKKDPKVTVTIDTYQWGLVFFREEQQKEHFILRA